MTEVDEAERRARVVMGRLCEPGDPDACRLVAEFSAVDVVGRLAGRDGDQPSKLADWRERLPLADYDELMALADAAEARFVCPGDDEWPDALVDLDTLAVDATGRRTAAPFGLWVRGAGRLASLTERSVAIVGSRASSAYGDRIAGQLAFDCVAAEHSVVSGGAYGIDAAAHRGALSRGGLTVAVLANGIDRYYPTGNTTLQRQICAAGALVSEAAPGAHPTRSRFLVRNRLIAALTRGTVVVEAAVRSGSLNTARWARDLARPVMGVPGPVTSLTSAGVHELLRQPDALLVTDGAEVVQHVSPIGTVASAVRSGPVLARDELPPRAREVVEALPAQAARSEAAIARAAGVRRSEVAEQLALLERADLVERVGPLWRLRPDPSRR